MKRLFIPRGPLQRQVAAPLRMLWVIVVGGLALLYIWESPHLHTHPFAALALAVILTTAIAAWWETLTGAVCMVLVLSSAHEFAVLPDESTLFLIAAAGIVWLNRSYGAALDERDAARAERDGARRSALHAQTEAAALRAQVAFLQRRIQATAAPTDRDTAAPTDTDTQTGPPTQAQGQRTQSAEET